MNLYEAFAAIEHLPARERLLIGTLGDEDSSWSSGSIDLLDRVDDLWNKPVTGNAPGMGSDISNAIADYRLGEAKMVVITFTTTDGKNIILALGPESRQAIAKSIDGLAQELIRRHAH